MNNIVKHLTTLYEQELYTNVISLCDFITTICEQKQEVTPFTRFQIFVLYADSYYHTQQYAEAENVYMQALQIRKYIMKPKNATKIPENQKDHINDVEIKFKVHICCVKQKQLQRAIEILQSIPLRSRTPKINMALGNLYRDNGSMRSAISCYKEVLKENPLCLDAAENLFKLGVKGTEVNSLMLEATTDLNWMHIWLRGQAQMHSNNVVNALKTFKSLDSTGLLKNNPTLLYIMASCYTVKCDYVNALNCMQQAIRLLPHMRKGRDLYAFLLARQGDIDSIKELERLTYTDISVNNWSAEQWTVNGYLMYANKKYERSAYFGTQALVLNKRCVEALLLKAKAFLQLQSYNEVLRHAEKVRQLAPYRFEGHNIIVECYLAMGNHISDALRYALNACKQLNYSPQAVTLYASVLSKDPINASKVKSYLEKALCADKTYTPAVLLLAEHLHQEQNYEEELNLLKKHSEVTSSARIHQLMGDALVLLHRDEEAFDHYSMALRIDPNNQRAHEGISSMGRQDQISTKMNGAYYVTVVDGNYVVEPRDITPDSDQDLHEGWPSNQDFMNFE